MVKKAFDIEKSDNYDDQKEITNEINTNNVTKNSIGEKASNCSD